MKAIKSILVGIFFLQLCIITFLFSNNYLSTDLEMLSIIFLLVGICFVIRGWLLKGKE